MKILPLFTVPLCAAVITGCPAAEIDRAPVVLEATPEGWVRSPPVAGGLTFAYPQRVGGEFVMLAAGPPGIETVQGYACVAGDEENSSTERRAVGGKTYCVTKTSEGAAGSTFNTYGYTTDIGRAVVRVSFTVRLVECGNFDEPTQAACTKEQASFDPDALASSIVASIR